MQHVVLRNWLLGAICALCVAGCRSEAQRRPYLRDPLLARQQPIDGKGGLAPPVMLAQAEPQPPPLPAEAYVALPPAYRSVGKTAPVLAAAPARQPHESSQTTAAAPPAQGQAATPMTEPRSLTRVEATPVSRPKDSDVYAHASDYAWLQGVLERDAGGGWLMRYGKSAADRWGGSMSLQDDARLSQFRSGDVVVVEGMIAAGSVTGKAHPTYRIRDIRLIQRMDL
jgi:hypothetical protein